MLWLEDLLVISHKWNDARKRTHNSQSVNYLSTLAAPYHVQINVLLIAGTHI